MDSATYVRDGIEEAVTCLMWCFGRKKCPPEVVAFRLARGEFRFFFFFDVVQKVGGDGARPASVTSSLCDANYDVWSRFSVRFESVRQTR